jgi:molybdopterin molybdotransferase
MAHRHPDDPRPLLRLEEARDRMLAGVEPLPAELVALDDAIWRVLAEPVDSRLTLPPWDNSAMDGFAVRSEDVPGASVGEPLRLRVTGEVAAGHAPEGEVTAGTAMRILTGGMLPFGADAIVPVEDTDAPEGVAALPEWVAIHQPAAPGAHVRPAGSDLREGDRLLDAGASLTPQALAVIAASGHGSVCVRRRPRVAVIATGDELVTAGQPVGPAQIPDSNSVSIAAQATDAGAEVIRLGVAPDDFDEVMARLRRAMDSADVVVATGGVSVGAHDLVKDAFERLGRMELWRVAIQPGKPLAFALAERDDGTPVRLFGLPGNPVSSFVTFELFVRPVLRRLGGHADLGGRQTVRARLVDPVASSPGRRTFVRVRLTRDSGAATDTGWTAALAGGQGSHVLSALAQADGLAVVPEDVEMLPPGATVDVIRLDSRTA